MSNPAASLALKDLSNSLNAFAALICPPEVELSTEEAADLLNVTQLDLTRSIENGALHPGYHFSGKGQDRVWSESRLKAWSKSDPEGRKSAIEQWQILAAKSLGISHY